MELKDLDGKLRYQIDDEKSLANVIEAAAENKVSLRRLNLTRAPLRGARLRGLNFEGSDFSEADLSEADFEDADLTGCKFDDADLVYADLTMATLQGASFVRARLASARLLKADCRDADFREAVLHGVQAGLPRGIRIDGAFVNDGQLGDRGTRIAVLTEAEWRWLGTAAGGERSNLDGSHGPSDGRGVRHGLELLAHRGGGRGQAGDYLPHLRLPSVQDSATAKRPQGYGAACEQTHQHQALSRDRR